MESMSKEMEYPDEINHPWHPKHPLRIIHLESIADVICRSCGKQRQEEEELETKCYGCNICGDFDVHLDCAMNPPPLVVDRPNTHEHTLTLLTREVSFICNACGVKGKASPYVCLSCCFMIHIDCINLPLVILTNRHTHRISHTFSLASDMKMNCGVCHKGIDSRFGAYSCPVCPSFYVHSGCATRNDIWDGVELDGILKEELRPPQPFNVTSEDIIKHFSHEEHELRRITDSNEDDACCYACNLDVFPYPVYKCMEAFCGFTLHESCAKLPRETRSPIHRHTLTLHYEDAAIFRCGSCDQVFNGYRYSCSECHVNFDSKCVSITERLLRGGHRHPLYLNFDYKTCCACGQIKSTPLSCEDCKYALCFKCATLPNRTRYKDDAHLLSLNHDGRASGKLFKDQQQQNWCDSCETRVNPLKTFYECCRCRTAVHTNCARGGDLRNLRIGVKFNLDGYKCEVVPTDQLTIRCCSCCERRNEGPSMLRSCSASDEHLVTYFCSFDCFKTFVTKNKALLT